MAGSLPGLCRESPPETAPLRVSTPAMVLRPFTPDDLPGVLTAFTAAIHSLASAWYSPAKCRAWADSGRDAPAWLARLASMETLVATKGGAVAGFIGVTDDGWIDLLYTHPDHAREGVASRLYTATEEHLAARGVRRFGTHSSLAAQAFFARHGFFPVGQEEVECRGERLRRVVMRKDA